MHHFVVKFSSPQAARGHRPPPNQNPADVPGRTYRQHKGRSESEEYGQQGCSVDDSGQREVETDCTTSLSASHEKQEKQEVDGQYLMLVDNSKAPLKLRPRGTIQICLLLLLLFKPTITKPQARKLD